MQSSSYYAGLISQCEAKIKELQEDINNYTSLKESAISCIPQIESIIKTYKNVGTCLQYVSLVDNKPYDNGQCLANANKLEEILQQLNLLVNECTTELTNLENEKKDVENKKQQYKSLYSIALEYEKQQAYVSNQKSSNLSNNSKRKSSNLGRLNFNNRRMIQ